MTQLLLHKAALPGRAIEEAAEWMVDMILGCTGVTSRSKCGSRMWSDQAYDSELHVLSARKSLRYAGAGSRSHAQGGRSGRQRAPQYGGNHREHPQVGGSN